MYDTYMSTPGNTAKLGAIHSNIQTAQVDRPWLGADLHCISQHTTESALYPTMPARHSSTQHSIPTLYPTMPARH